MTAVIETHQLTKTYGSHRGIVDVNLAVNEGDRIRKGQFLLQIKAETNQLWFVQEGAVHQHASRPAVIANADGKR